MYYIEIEDLVANALIELLERFEKKTISFQTLSRYGDIVIDYLIRNNKDVVALYTRDKTDKFFRDYTNFFEVDDNGVTLKEGVTVQELKDKFRYNMAFDVFLAFVSDDAVRILNAA